MKNRKEFIDYCMLKLGHPVIQINMDPLQIDACVDDALEYFRQYHKDGVEFEILKAVITKEMETKQAIPMPSYINNVKRSVPYLSEFDHALSTYPQAAVNFPFVPSLPSNVFDFSVTGYVAYQVTNETYKYLFQNQKIPTYRRSTNTVTFNADVYLKEGDAYLFEVYSNIDFDSSDVIWNDIWLKEFAVALMRIQWGNNLSKYGGVQLPTGITLNGEAILEQGKEEREKLIDRLHNEFAEPLDFFMA